MKKRIISGFLALFAVVALNAQNQEYRVMDLDMNEYENNSVHVYNVHGTFDNPLDEAKLHLYLTNVGANPIKVSAQIVEMTNTDGSLAQFCIGGPAGNCFNPISEGSFYPNANGGILEAGGNWGLFDYLLNLDPTNLVEYKIRFVQKDDSGNDIPNTDFFISYRYDANMGVSDVNAIAIAKVYPTVAKGFTTVNLQEKATAQILNVEGKAVKSFKLNSGESQLDLNGLSAGVYWVAFKGESGKSTNIRIVVK